MCNNSSKKKTKINIQFQYIFGMRRYVEIHSMQSTTHSIPIPIAYLRSSFQRLPCSFRKSHGQSSGDFQRQGCLLHRRMILYPYLCVALLSRGV